MRSPKHEGRLCSTALKDAELLRVYRLLSFLQAPFAFVFWKIEQVKGQLQDRFDNERSET